MILLAITCTPALLAWRWPRHRRAAGAAGLAALFLFAASGHFFLIDVLAAMLPPWLPARGEIVVLTGVAEVAIAVGLLLPATRRAAGMAAIAALLAFLPANVYAAFARVDLGGHIDGPGYLWVRVPLQGILIYWAWHFVVRRPALDETPGGAV